MKHFGWSEKDVLWGTSYVNVCMYLSTIPDYDLGSTTPGKKGEKGEKDEVVKHSDGIDGLGIFDGLN